MKTSEKFRDSMFLASSRTMGEIYMEPIIRKFRRLHPTPTDENDAVNDDGKFSEIKCARVLLKKQKKKEISLAEEVVSVSENNVLTRLIPFADCYTAKYDANMQNIKRDHFQYLIYVMLFKDCLKIFERDRNDISKITNWSGKHGRFDEYGKSGQFNVTKNKIKEHLENSLVDTLTWDEAYEIAKSIRLNVNKKHNNTK